MCTASRQAGKQGKPGSQHELPKALPEVLATLGLGEKQSTHHWPWSSARADNIQGMNCKWLQMAPNGSKFYPNFIQMVYVHYIYTNSLCFMLLSCRKLWECCVLSRKIVGLVAGLSQLRNVNNPMLDTSVRLDGWPTWSKAALRDATVAKRSWTIQIETVPLKWSVIIVIVLKKAVQLSVHLSLWSSDAAKNEQPTVNSCCSKECSRPPRNFLPQAKICLSCVCVCGHVAGSLGGYELVLKISLKWYRMYIQTVNLCTCKNIAQLYNKRSVKWSNYIICVMYILYICIYHLIWLYTKYIYI